MTLPQLRELVEHYTFTTPRGFMQEGPTTQCVAAVTATKVILPRGDLKWLLGWLRGQGIAVEYDVRMSTGQPLNMPFRGQLFQFQEPVVQAMVNNFQGCVVSPCGSGKTTASIAAIQRANCSALVLVHSYDLAKQWIASIERFLGFRPGLVMGHRINIEPITVAMIQTLAEWNSFDVHELGKRFGISVCDEFHHIPAKQWAQVQNMLPCRYRWGLSATPIREDGMQIITNLIMGPKIAEVKYEELLRGGYLEKPVIVRVATNFVFPPGPKKEALAKRLLRLHGRLMRDQHRNEIIVNLALSEVHRGRTVLILAGFIKHTLVLAAGLSARGVKAYPITSRTKKDDRDRLIRELRHGQIDVLVATSLADEGLDIQALSTVIQAFPARAKGRTKQRLGRVMRRSIGKDSARFYDLIDGNVPLLVKRAQSRDEVYREVLGPELEIVEIPAPGPVDGNR